MSLIKQILLSLIVIAGVGAAWIAYVPSSLPWLDRIGVLDTLGIVPPEPVTSGAGRAFGPGAPAVIVAEIELRNQRDQVSAIGDGRALRSVVLRAEVDGRIRSVNVSSGQYVDSGAVLLGLEDAAEQIELERARLVLSDAERDLARVNALSGTGAVTAVREQEARLNLKTAELELRQAEVDLRETSIRAPISGWVGLIELDVGERLAAQEQVAVITDRSKIIVDFRVPERVIGQLKVGQSFAAEPLARRGEVLTGEITALDNIVDRTSRTLRVRGALNNDDDFLRAGMAFSVSMRFPGGAYPAVPPLAVQWSSDGAFVWAVREGKAVRVPVVIRQRNDDSVLVEGDLPEGTLIVVEGVQTLRPGADVEIVSQVSGSPVVDVVPQQAKL